jgi:hypothetical protein
MAISIYSAAKRADRDLTLIFRPDITVAKDLLNASLRDHEKADDSQHNSNVKIRSEQMEVFDAIRQRDFERQIAEHLKAQHGGIAIPTTNGPIAVSDLSTDNLVTMVRYCIAKARAYGVTWESGLAAYAVLAFRLGPNFDEHPAIRRELTNAAVPANSILDHLCCVISAKQWDEAKTACGVEAWANACPRIRLTRREPFDA